MSPLKAIIKWDVYINKLYQVYGDPTLHKDVRQMCMDYIEQEKEHFSQFITEDFYGYLKRKRQDSCYGNNLEIQACAELFNRNFEV